MEIISMDAQAFDSLTAKVENLAREADLLCNDEDYSLQEWLDNQDVCHILNVSKRTLQTYRDNGSLPFSQIDRKIYYKPKDVDAVLQASVNTEKRHE